VGDPAGAGPVIAAIRGGGARGGVPGGVAADALIAMGAGAGCAVSRALDDDDAGVRTVAALVAGQLLLTAAATQLRTIVRHDVDPVVRVHAARALGRMGGVEDVPALAWATDGAEPRPLRRAAAQALGEIGHRDAVPVLVRLLHDPDRRLAELSGLALTRVPERGREVLGAAAGGTVPGGLSDHERELAARAARSALSLERLGSRSEVLA
jgi:HEAT repeat protein